MADAYQRPFEVDAREYPFDDHWFPLDDGVIHYVDEGSGPTVLLLHGNPTWSYLYRRVIRKLGGECRLIAPDYPGFGMSKPPSGYGYRPAEHAECVQRLIEHLTLEDLTLVVQDWGGPIGLRYAVEHPGNMRALVLMNTWVFQPSGMATIFSLAMGGWPVGKWLQTRRNFFARRIVPSSIYHKEKVTDSLKAAYTAPFPTPQSRQGTWVFPREIRKSARWLADIESKLEILEDLPVEMLWAMKDPAFGHQKIIDQWRGYLKNTTLETLDDASHYLQEDRPDRVVAAIRRALERSAESRQELA
jgi:haloalkane dehalogenase